MTWYLSTAANDVVETSQIQFIADDADCEDGEYPDGNTDPPASPKFVVGTDNDGVDGRKLEALTGGIDNFVAIPMSPNLMHVCACPQPNPPADDAATVEYHNVGIVVSDFIIGPGYAISPTSVVYESFKCVSAAPAQTVRFEATSNTFLSGNWYTWKFWFRALTTGGDVYTQCGSPPNASTTSSSKFEYMTGSVLSTRFQTSMRDFWQMDFDFTAAQTTSVLYRLCVDTGDAVLDLKPYGVRVNDISVGAISNNQVLGSSIQPLAGQNVRISYSGLSLKAGDQFRFIYSDYYSTCRCVNDDTCTGGAKPKTGLLSIVGTNGDYVLDFSSFRNLEGGTSSPARMCVFPADGSDPYELSCVEVDFVVTADPNHAPANDGQIISLNWDGVALKTGDEVYWKVPGAECVATNNPLVNTSSYSNFITVGSSGSLGVFNFTNMRYGADVVLTLCVDSLGANTNVFEYAATNLTLTAPVVSISGDPHVRSARGEWMDFYGASGVYQLMRTSGLVANAKMGYAVRDSHLIWHPRVMRPGTMMEEVGIKLTDSGTSVRLGVQGGGVVSIRKALHPTAFWTSKAEQSATIDGYALNWAVCASDRCNAHMPWGIHERLFVLSIEGNGEFLQMFVTRSGGYHFIDVEALPSSKAVGLLPDASFTPEDLADRLRTGGERHYMLGAGVAAITSS